MFTSFWKLLHNVRFSGIRISNSYVYSLLVYYPFIESVVGRFRSVCEQNGSEHQQLQRQARCLRQTEETDINLWVTHSLSAGKDYCNHLYNCVVHSHAFFILQYLVNFDDGMRSEERFLQRSSGVSRWFLKLSSFRNDFDWIIIILCRLPGLLVLQFL